MVRKMKVHLEVLYQYDTIADGLVMRHNQRVAGASVELPVLPTTSVKLVGVTIRDDFGAPIVLVNFPVVP